MENWKPKSQVIKEKFEIYLRNQVKNISSPVDLTDIVLQRLANIISLIEFFDKRTDDF